MQGFEVFLKSRSQTSNTKPVFIKAIKMFRKNKIHDGVTFKKKTRPGYKKLYHIKMARFVLQLLNVKRYLGKKP